jgi:hypothetical protein
MKRLIYALEDSTPDGINYRANLMVNKGWEVAKVDYVHPGGWFGKGRYIAVLTKKLPGPNDSLNVSLTINAGPVTQRS